MLWWEGINWSRKLYLVSFNFGHCHSSSFDCNCWPSAYSTNVFNGRAWRRGCRFSISKRIEYSHSEYVFSLSSSWNHSFMVRKSSRACFIQTYLPRFSLVFLFVFGMRDCTRVGEQHFPSDQVTLIFLKQRDHFGISACDIFLLLSIYSAGF